MEEDGKTDSPEREAGKTPRKLSKRLQRRLVLALVPPLAEKWMRWFNWTALKDNERLLTLVNPEELKSRVQSQQNPSIVAVWHNRLIFGPTAYQYMKGRGLVVMVSRSFDGDIISATLSRFNNYLAVRGGSSKKADLDKGGKEALARMIEYGKQGYDLVITPDGPQGPVYQAKQGVVDLARATGFPIFPVGCNCSRYLEAKSWDKTRFPLPYTHFVYRAGDPITVPPDADQEVLEKKRQEVEQALREVTEFADHFFD